MDADAVLQERLAYLRDTVDYLKSEQDRVRSFSEYRENVRLKRAIERSLQTAIEACLDIGRRIIALEGFRFPDDNQDVFRVLREENLVSDDLLVTLLDMARFRNLIVHDYARIDDALVYAILQKRLSDFDAFARAVQAYLESRESSSRP